MTTMIQATANDFYIGSKLFMKDGSSCTIVAKTHNPMIWEASFDGGVKCVFVNEAACYEVSQLHETAFVAFRGRAFASKQRKFAHDFTGFKGWHEIEAMPEKVQFIGNYHPNGGVISLIMKAYQ